MSKLHMEARKALSKSDLIKLTKENYNFGGTISAYEELDKYLTDNDLSIENIFIAYTGLYPFWYIEGNVYIALSTLEIEALTFTRLPERVKAQSEKLKEYWEEGRYSSFFALVETQFTFEVFANVYSEIPPSERYEVFIDIYTRNDYGFKDLNKEIIYSMFSEMRGTVNKNTLKVDKDGYLAIYRGMQNLSAELEDAYSWTTNLSIAIKFATNGNTVDSTVYKARVHHSKVVDFITTRGESEILVLPEDVESVKNMWFFNITEVQMNRLQRAGVVDEYGFYCTNLLHPEYFHNPEGIHGERHIKRVLFLTLLMADMDRLNKQDKQILIYASLYHDIGRTHDNRDESHGRKSVIKMNKLNLPLVGLTKEDKAILEFIIKYHSRPDKHGYKELPNHMNISDKVRAKDLFNRFKDCDNLDRVRLGDLDIEYLRTETGKNLVIAAHQLLKNIK